MIFCPRRFLADMESAVTFLGFLTDFLALDAVFVWSELLPAVDVWRIVVFVVFVDCFVRKGSGFDANLGCRILDSILYTDDDRKLRH